MLEIRLIEPLPIYPALLTHQRTAIARRRRGRTRPVVGTGPFRVASATPDRIVLERNPGYWRSGCRGWTRIEFRAGLAATAIARASAPARSTSPATCCPRTWRRSCATPASATGSSRRPRRTPTSCCSTAARGPATRTPSCAALSRGSCGRATSSGGRSGASPRPAVCLIPPGLLGHDPGRRSQPLTPRGGPAGARGGRVGAGDPAPGLGASRAPGPVRRAPRRSSRELGGAGRRGLGRDRRHGRLPGLVREERGPRPPDRTLEPRLRRSRQLHPHALPLRDGPLPELVLVGGGGPSARGGPLREPARRPGGPLPEVREPALRGGALIPLFHDVDYRLASPKVRGLALRGTAPYVNYAELGGAESRRRRRLAARRGGGILHVPDRRAS